jgi:hypothetical protein
MNTPLVIGALIVSILLMFWIFSVLKTTFKVAFFIAIVVFGLQVLTGIGPQQVWAEVFKMFSNIPKWLGQWGNKAKPPSDFREKTQSLLWFMQIAVAQMLSSWSV